MTATLDPPFLDERTAGIVHDLNNVLAVVLGTAAALRERAAKGLIALDAESDDELDAVVAAVERGRALLRATLAPAGLKPLLRTAPEAASPGVVLLDEAVRGLQHVIRLACRPSVQLRLDLACHNQLAAIHQAALERVLLNLAVNASDSMDGQGVLTLRTRIATRRPPPSAGTGSHAGVYVCLEVLDTGHGVPPDIIARMGEPWFTTKPPGKGTGLGLATVRRLLIEAGGFLSIDSVAGQGTCVGVHLPACPPPGNPAMEPAAGRTVLLVEDSATLRILVERMLLRRGWTVLSAGSAESALSLVANLAPETVAALVTDHLLPVMSGVELVRELRQRLGRAELPVLLMSGFGGAAAEVAQAAGSGAAFLSKPFDLRDLALALDALVQQSRGSFP